MKKLLLHPLFLLGLAMRAALIVLVAPIPVSEWFAPFLDSALAAPWRDPWAAWTSTGHTPLAFPYGYAMLLSFAPFGLLAMVTGLPMLLAYKLTLLAADLVVLLALRQLLPLRPRLLLLTYWLSPVILIASYGLGLNDVVPAALLVVAVVGLKRGTLAVAGFALAAAISAKLSMVVALPFFAIYLYKNRVMRQRAWHVLAGFGAGVALFGLPFLFSSAGLAMLAGNPEVAKLYQLAVPLTGDATLYVVPLLYLVTLYFVWRVNRVNFDLFQATTGAALLLIVLMTPGSPGWFAWSIPFLSLFQAQSGRMTWLLTGAFSGLYALITLLGTPVQLTHGAAFDLAALIGEPLAGTRTVALLHTALFAIGVVLVIRICRETIGRNYFFRLSRKPFVIGIAGDSGAGKDTFAAAIGDIFGRHSVVQLSGDDYHLWDRQRPMWQVMTHLNPMANDLERFTNDLIALADGKSVMVRHYDHAVGRMTRPFLVKSNDFIIASGLHALYIPLLRDFYNIRIYLDIHEGLRRYFKLQRDVHQRGHTIDRVLQSFERREPDSERFIRPQARHADLVLSLQPIHPKMVEDIDSEHPMRLKLVVRTRNSFNELSLNRILVGVCGLHVDMSVGPQGHDVEIAIEGETSSADIAMAAQILCPQVLEFLDQPTQWHDGMLGLMQLITLSHINQALTRRIRS